MGACVGWRRAGRAGTAREESTRDGSYCVGARGLGGQPLKEGIGRRWAAEPHLGRGFLPGQRSHNKPGGDIHHVHYGALSARAAPTRASATPALCPPQKRLHQQPPSLPTSDQSAHLPIRPERRPFPSTLGPMPSARPARCPPPKSLPLPPAAPSRPAQPVLCPSLLTLPCQPCPSPCRSLMPPRQHQASTRPQDTRSRALGLATRSRHKVLHDPAWPCLASVCSFTLPFVTQTSMAGSGSDLLGFGMNRPIRPPSSPRLPTHRCPHLAREAGLRKRHDQRVLRRPHHTIRRRRPRAAQPATHGRRRRRAQRRPRGEAAAAAARARP